MRYFSADAATDTSADAATDAGHAKRARACSVQPDAANPGTSCANTDDANTAGRNYA